MATYWMLTNLRILGLKLKSSYSTRCNKSSNRNEACNTLLQEGSSEKTTSSTFRMEKGEKCKNSIFQKRKHRETQPSLRMCFLSILSKSFESWSLRLFCTCSCVKVAINYNYKKQIEIDKTRLLSTCS